MSVVYDDMNKHSISVCVQAPETLLKDPGVVNRKSGSFSCNFRKRVVLTPLTCRSAVNIIGFSQGKYVK